MTSACRCFGNPVQKYNKKKEQRKIATPLLLVLLDCYCGATAMLLVIVLSEAVVLERNGDDLVQFVVHDACVIVGVYIAFFLPLTHLFDKCTRLIIPAGKGLLQSLRDLCFFLLVFGFLGKQA